MALDRQTRINGGAAIRQRRADLGLSQAALAQAIGCGAMTVSHWEAGDCEPRASVRPALATALQVELFSALYYRAPQVQQRADPVSPLSVRCPVCSSVEGERCSAVGGGYLKPSKSHAARKAAAMRGGR